MGSNPATRQVLVPLDSWRSGQSMVLIVTAAAMQAQHLARPNAGEWTEGMLLGCSCHGQAGHEFAMPHPDCRLETACG